MKKLREKANQLREEIRKLKGEPTLKEVRNEIVQADNLIMNLESIAYKIRTDEQNKELAHLKESVKKTKLLLKLEEPLNKSFIQDSRSISVVNNVKSGFPTRTIRKPILKENKLGELIDTGKTKLVKQKLYKDIKTYKKDGKTIHLIPKDYSKRMSQEASYNSRKQFLRNEVKKINMVQTKIGKSNVTLFR